MISRIPGRPPRRSFGAVLGRSVYFVFLACGVFALAYCGYVLIAAHFYQTIQKSRLENVDQSEEHRPVVEGSAIGEMKVARLGLSAVFVQGDSPRILRHAVGHISETALPGEPGNVVLTGHRDSFFRSLRNIRQGDTVELKTPGREFAYQVDWTEVVLPSDVGVVQPSGDNTLTLVTCFPFYYVGPAPMRFVVRAHQIGTLPAQPAVSDAPAHL